MSLCPASSAMDSAVLSSCNTQTHTHYDGFCYHCTFTDRKDTLDIFEWIFCKLILIAQCNAIEKMCSAIGLDIS